MIVIIAVVVVVVVVQKTYNLSNVNNPGKISKMILGISARFTLFHMVSWGVEFSGYSLKLYLVIPFWYSPQRF